MSKFVDKWQPKDVIAGIIVIGAITLLILGIDNIVAFALLGIIAGYYGFDLAPFVKIGRNQGKKEGD